MSVAPNLGAVSGLLSSCKMDFNEVQKAEKTHYIINVDNGRTLRFYSDAEVKYAHFLNRGGLHIGGETCRRT